MSVLIIFDYLCNIYKLHYRQDMNSLNHRNIVPLLGTLALASPAANKEKPNIIIIYTDDMGISDIGCYGGIFTPTPNIDRIGNDGIRFTQYYTACPISSPSRVGMTTGMYPTKWGITNYLDTRKMNRERKSNDYLSAEAPAIARSFQKAGYATAHIGKWHMGGGRDVTDMPQISEFGFDKSLSTWESPSPDPAITASNWIWSDQDSIKRWERTRYFVDNVLGFLKENKGRPCYIHLWPDDMHTPYVPSKEEYDKGKKMWNAKVNFIPVLAEYDRQIGRLLDGIAALGLKDNTIIVFTSDNGPAPSYKNARTAGLRGQKGTLYEGGIRMPFLVCWPARIKGGKVNSTTVITALDLFPTLCKLAGIEPQTNGYQLDGTDISDVLLGKTARKRNVPMFWEFGQQFVGKAKPQNAYQFRSPNIAVRDGKWKLLVNYDGTDAELYNIENDEKETTNLAATHTGIALHMKKMAIDWYNASFRKHAGELRND